ncbi:MAG: RNA polymerase sporulation sigma factor SigH [Vallitaleaceae bacterium]|jgi:RNA polymerase sporulation-specific sigma factor|nr:RNA polymerase sporulation sigma factor SigH [Vallitaleaceae bacterium]
MPQTMEKISFVDHSDENILHFVRDNHDNALDFLMRKYKALVEKKAQSYFLMGASRDDIIQEGMIGLFKAIRDFDFYKETSFFSFADLCITRQIISAVKASTRQKHMPLNKYVSLDKPIYQNEDKTGLLELMPSKKATNPEDVYIGEENKHFIEDALSKKLSGFEKIVLEYYIGGISYVEIAEILDKPSKSIDNALQRIKKKVLEIIQ